MTRFKKSDAFQCAASMLLDSMEDEFQITAPRGRATTIKALIDILDYYCLPKDGPSGDSAVEREMRAELQ